MRDDDRVRILHMIDADLDTDRMLLFAIVRAIEVLGEAASKVTNEIKEAARNVPWTAIVGMRNRLIHGYFDVDADVVWKTVTEEIPGLRRSLKTLVENQ
jgi:uncharacterized protein with HEPN domain